VAESSGSFDVTIFVTYLYYSTWAGLLTVRSPSILHPTAHDEPPLYLSLFDQLFAIPDAFGFLTEEEASLVTRRFDVSGPMVVTGSGIKLDPTADPPAFRRRFGLGDRPYLVYAGRVDPAKGCDELHRHFSLYKQRRPGSLALVMVGDRVFDLPRHPDIVMTGFVDDATKNSGIAGADLLVHPSQFESFSIALAEAWAAGVPAVVQARSEVLRGQCRRAGGGLWYRNYAEFEAALDLLLSDGALRQRLGEAGRRYVRENYAWQTVTDRYEDLLDRVRSAA
jgi:glycosyltransferase involved in cell wall biosynthesis